MRPAWFYLAVGLLDIYAEHRQAKRRRREERAFARALEALR